MGLDENSKLNQTDFLFVEHKTKVLLRFFLSLFECNYNDNDVFLCNCNDEGERNSEQALSSQDGKYKTKIKIVVFGIKINY